MKGFVCNEVAWILDPLQKFNKVPADTLLQSIGLIPTFFDLDADDVVGTALAEYGFAGPEMKGGTIDGKGVYTYPQDPDLYPIAQCFVNDTMVYIYDYGIVAFVTVNNRKLTMYRFD